MNEQPGGRFQILVDGKLRSYACRKESRDRIRGISQEPELAQRGCGEGPAKGGSDSGRLQAGEVRSPNG
jgi:hypothetical protein